MESPTKRINPAEGSEQDKNAPGPSPTSVPESKGLINQPWTALVRLGSWKSYEDLLAIRSGNFYTEDNGDVYTARKMGRVALIYCFCESCLSASMGVMWNLSDTTDLASSLLYIYITYRFLLVVKRMVDQIYFIRDEVKISRGRARPESQLSMLTQARPEPHRSDQSMVTSAPSDNYSLQTTSPSPSRPLSIIEQWSTGSEHQTNFGPPGRVDTEADIGLVPLARRKTFPSQQNGKDA